VKLIWPAPERNKGPILEVLGRVLPRQGTVLEVASGTGQHVVHFARHLPNIIFLPSDVNEENLASIRSWIAESGLANLRAPKRLDVTDADWDIALVDAVICANLIHIAPWECALGLLQGAARHLRPGGLLILYGPYRIGGEHTAPSNAEFDTDLRRRDPRYGVRDLEAVASTAESLGLAFMERVVMPANNQTLVFARALTGWPSRE